MPLSLAWYDRLLPYAPFFTAGIAFGALVTAITAICKQTQTARRRAAIDLFFKTDLDEKMLDAHKDFETAQKKLAQHLASGASVKTFEQSDEASYRAILKYLNVHELIAVGIRNGVLDGNVCYNYWADVLLRHVRKTAAVIEYEVETDGAGSAAFLELRKLNIKWSKRVERWRQKQKK